MELKAEKWSLRRLLSLDQQQFRIPPYQRPYAWTSQQVDDLWDDLVGNLDAGHFLGSLVLSTEDEWRPQVIDGQQRLTTLMLLLSAVRDECHSRGLSQQVQLVDKWLTADAFESGDAKFKFKTGSANWPVFRDVVLRGPTDPERRSPEDFDKPTRARNLPLLDNLARLRAQLTTALAGLSEGERATWLEKFHKFLLERVELVVIEVKSLADAFLIFETLNDRGLQLSAADLLKSHLLGEIAKKAGGVANRSEASQLAGQLADLLEQWERYDGGQRSVARAAAAYFLESVDAVPDVNVGGLLDDAAVVHAAREALAATAR